MPTIKFFGYCAIQMYHNEHGEPHFHLVFHDGRRVTVFIKTLEIVGSRIPRSLLDEPLAWAAENRELIRNRWKELKK